MSKSTPRDIIEGLSTLLKNAKANKRGWIQNTDNVHWVTLAKKLISTQAAELETLRTEALGRAKTETAPPTVNTDLDTQGTDPEPESNPAK